MEAGIVSDEAAEGILEDIVAGKKTAAHYTKLYSGRLARKHLRHVAKKEPAATPEFDPRCGPDVTTAGGRPFSCESNAKHGECEKNPGWMIMFCPNACKMCDLKADPSLRCDRKRLNISDSPIFKPGDMDRMFKRLITAEKYKNVLRRLVKEAHRVKLKVLL